MTSTWRGLQVAFKSHLWLSWATAVWAAASYLIIHADSHLPHFVELLTSLSRGFAVFGGCLALLYVLLAARTTLLVVSGLVAGAVNFWYCWDYVRALF